MIRRIVRSGRQAATLVLALLPSLAAGAGLQDAGMQAGESAGVVWLQVPAGGSFRLEPGDASVRLVFPDWSAPATGALDTGLQQVRSFDVQAEGTGTAVALPFAAGDLREVAGGGDGWRFTFTVSWGAGGLEEDQYRLGVRDVIEISVFGHDDLSRTDAVPPDGVLTMPLIGEVRVAGRTVGSIEEELQRRLAADFLVDPQVNVRVKEYESQWVNVVGQVKTPGKYPIKGVTTLIDVLTQAGGLTKEAGSDILVSREKSGAQEQVHVNRDELFAVNNEKANLRMRHGDVVEVRDRPVFYIQGEVAKPGGYPLERGYTLLKAISIAGGMSQWADRKEVELHREDDKGPQKIIVNLKAIEQRKKPDVELQPEDIIIVKRRLL